MKQLINVENHEGEMVVTSREIAENFEKDHKNVIRDIENLIGQLKIEHTPKYFIQAEYQHEQNKQTYKEYLLTRDGFTLLAMGFTGGKAIEWKLKYIDAFNKMEQALKEQSKPTCIEDLIIMQAQSLKDMREQVNQANYHALEAKAEAEKSREEIQSMRDLVAINSSDWKQDCKSLIVKMAKGQNITYQDMYKEAYDSLERRAGCQLGIRKTNKQKKMALEGVCKSKINNVSKLEVIEEDKKLTECFLSIIKEMAIKYGIV